MEVGILAYSVDPLKREVKPTNLGLLFNKLG